MTAPPFYADEAVTLHLGEMLDVLPTLPDASVDAVVCDPPYGLANHHPRVIAETLAAWLAGDRAYVPDGVGFMGVSWDRFVPPPAAWDECWRVLKPGGHLVAFAAPRTADLMGLSIRLAGFEIRDSLHWIYGSGMPKGQNIGKSIDKRRDDRDQVLQVTAWLATARLAAGWTTKQIDALFGFRGSMASHWTTQGVAAAVPTPEQWERLRDAIGFDDTEILPLVEELNGRKGTIGEAWAEREVITTVPDRWAGKGDVLQRATQGIRGDVDITAPASEAARKWQGWNTNLKPAHEPIILARKSTGFDTTVANVLRHGTGAINVDATRTVAGQDYRDKCASVVGPGSNVNGDAYSEWTGVREDSASDLGRWPTNVLLAHPPLLDATGQPIGDACADGCVPGCPVAEMDRQSGVTRSSGGSGAASGCPGQNVYGTYGQDAGANAGGLGDSGGASRFFPVFRYEAKAPASERPRLADGTAHVSVKPLELMRWLVRLVCQPGGLILDPFAGSGTTLEAAAIEGFRAVGVERHEPYAELCRVRLSKPLEAVLFGDIA